jgi:Phosphoribosyl transferase/TRSP domain C terminus to PRTase_2
MTLDQCRWVSERLDIKIRTAASSDLGGLGLAIRENLRRTQLLVSPPLAKHVPVVPRVAFDAARALAGKVLNLGPLGERALALGLAETATGLAELLAAELRTADYIHSTRFLSGPVRGESFTEVHSHAPDHRLIPDDPEFLRGRRTVVVIDDELTTARTVVNLLEVLARFSKVERVVIACLIDARSKEVGSLLHDFARRHRCAVEVCSLAELEVVVGREAPGLAASLPRPGTTSPRPDPIQGRLHVVEVGRPPTSGRYGLAPDGIAARARFAELVAEAIHGRFSNELAGQSIHVIGVEEQIALPIRVAAALERMGSPVVKVNSTTRSPAVVIDEPGYPLRTELRFTQDGADRRIYNTPCGAGWTIVIPDDDGYVSSDLLRQLPGERIAVRWRDRREE